MLWSSYENERTTNKRNEFIILSLLAYRYVDITSLVKVHREYSPAARILHTKFG